MGTDMYWSDRMELLWELIEAHPNVTMRKHQQTALKFYPIASKELTRKWLSIRTAFKCVEMFCPLIKQQNKDLGS